MHDNTHIVTRHVHTFIISHTLLLYKHTIKREDITPLHPSIYMFFSAIRSAPPIGRQKITFAPSYTFNFDPI